MYSKPSESLNLAGILTDTRSAMLQQLATGIYRSILKGSSNGPRTGDSRPVLFV